MTKEAIKKVKVVNQESAAGFIFFVAWIGALVYFIQQANGFWEVILAFLQSIVWPAYVLHAVLEILNV